MQHRPDLLLVYLHGNAGQWVDHSATNVMLAIPGVLGVAESEVSPSILLVRINPPEEQVTAPRGEEETAPP